MDLRFGDFRLIERERALAGPNGPVVLAGAAYELLRVLLARPGELVSKSDLLDAAWPGVVVEENTLQVHMSALRKALGQGFVATVHGRGYRYVGPEPVADEETPVSPPEVRGSNLTRYRVECVARDAEMAAVLELIGRQRLVSILGSGGVGKTTLALAAAAAVAPQFGGGVWVIDLASLSDGALVESAIIQTLGVPFRANAPPLRAILDHVGQRDMLLVVDNCEHLIGAVARVAKALLDEAPGLKILATTQVPLGIPAEHVFKLAPFALADAEDAQSAQFLAYCYEALGEKLSADELPVVAQLCRRLDGVALALKMAAARAATLGIEAVDRQIADHLAGLAAGWEPSLERHRSLMASLAWSHDLLSETERRMLRALGVFQGSFSLDGVRAVAGAGSDDSISELVRRSIVVRDGADRGRYRLLETTRHFALERLVEAGEEAEARTRHAEHMLATFMAGLEAWETVPDAAWLASQQLDGDNLRSALDWSRTQANWPVHVGLAACSYRFWIQTQLPAEGLKFCEAAQAHADGAPDEVAALLSLALAEFYRFYRLDIRVLDVLPRATAFYLAGTDRMRQVQALVLEGWSQTVLLNYDAARSALQRVDEMGTSLPTSKLKARALVVAAIGRWGMGDDVVGRAKLEAGLAMHRATGNTRGYWKSAMLSAEILHHNGDTSGAIELGLRVLPELREHANGEEHTGQVGNLCAYYMSAGDYEAARRLVAECGRTMPRDDKNGMWCLIQNAAELLAYDGALETAALLLGHADAGFDTWEDGRQKTEAMQRERVVALLAGAGMTDAERERFVQQGRALSVFEAEVLAGVAGAATEPRFAKAH
jgi:predicted ATPase/DNA-binding winged helix-turn-helix (wHTH) protein